VGEQRAIRVTRRQMLKFAAATAGGMAFTSALPRQVPLARAQRNPAPIRQGQPFAGQTVNAALIGGTEYEHTYEKIAQWEETSGATVNIPLKVSFQELVTKLNLDFTSGAGDYDVISTHQSYTPPWVPYLVDLRDYFNQEELGGFAESVIQAAHDSNSGGLYQIPRHVDFQIGFYRKDLFEDPKEQEAFKAKYGKELAPPNTWDDVKQVAEFFTRPPQVYGTGYAGAGEPFVIEFYMELIAAGGEMFDNNLNPVFNQEPGVTAINYYIDLFNKKVVPPGVNTYGWNEDAKAFTDGQEAFNFTYNGFYGAMKDPTKSNVAGKVGFFLRPQGPSRRNSMGAFHSYAVTQDARKRGVDKAAADLVRFLTSEEIMYFEAKEGGLLPVRPAVFARLQDEAASDPVQSQFLKTAKQSADELILPFSIFRVPIWGSIANIMFPFLEKAQIGQMEPQAALDAAHEQVVKAMKDARLIAG